MDRSREPASAQGRLPMGTGARTSTTASCRCSFGSPSRPTFRLRNVNHRERTAIPRCPAALDIPGDVQLVAGRIDGRAERTGRDRADLVLEVGVQEGDHFARLRLGVELDDRAAVVLATTVGAGDVVDVAANGIDVDRGDVIDAANSGGAKLFGFFRPGVE